VIINLCIEGCRSNWDTSSKGRGTSLKVMGGLISHFEKGWIPEFRGGLIIMRPNSDREGKKEEGGGSLLLQEGKAGSLEDCALVKRKGRIYESRRKKKGFQERGDKAARHPFFFLVRAEMEGDAEKKRG